MYLQEYGVHHAHVFGLLCMDCARRLDVVALLGSIKGNQLSVRVPHYLPIDDEQVDMCIYRHVLHIPGTHMFRANVMRLD